MRLFSVILSSNDLWDCFGLVIWGSEVTYSSCELTECGLLFWSRVEW